MTAFLERENIDVLAMQEIKCRNDQFPTLAFETAGYQVFVNGLNQWNGVAVAARQGISAHLLGTEFYGAIDQPYFSVPPKPPQLEPRVLGVRVAGVECWSLYVPNGREVGHLHYQYKLKWLDSLRSHVIRTLDTDPESLGLYLGDFNVAPRDEDVWDLADFAAATHVSEPERQVFAKLLDPDTVADAVTLHDDLIGGLPGNLTEITRKFAPGWTYWDYQRARWRRNQGMKIDFALATPRLVSRVTGAYIDTAERDGEQPSDHAPVIVDFE
ncbi:putative exodeoxyribonuclease III [Mobiluncus curtisii ATCC 43063]|uniref:Putative exodeoxyribonuclease III n=1 Tax=Mobiluncus curtisii (strain ATCC 43063 / DSM 2711 / V125) TaxID=548479 RepID=D6ZJE6_MOBCV|nr:putative exodeoxyribonuclease III [Mobiluncus curtisii ATCC 43063]